MSKGSTIGLNSIRFLYYRYKDTPYYTFGLAIVIFSISLILFFRVIVPQIENWFSIRNEVIAARARIDTITNNINFMKNVDKSLLNDQVDVTMSALPAEKDFGPIITALSTAAGKSSVALEDFNFQIGSTGSSSGKLNNIPQKDISEIKLTVVISGDLENVSHFLKELRERLPLSEIELVTGDTQNTTVKLQFYQKEYPKFVFKDDEPIPPLSNKQLELISTLSKWYVIEDQPQDVGSESGIPLF